MKNLRPFTAPSGEYDAGLFYPSSDGPDEPSADWPLVARRLIREALEDYFALELDWYVGAGIPWYIGPRAPKAVCTPDTFVVPGARAGERADWHFDRESRTPAVCVQVATRANQGSVFGPIKDCCERLSVKEYLVFEADRVSGFRLRDRQYRPIRPAGDGGIRSQVLGLRLVNEYADPRFVDVATGEVVLTRREQALRSIRARQAGAAPR